MMLSWRPLPSCLSRCACVFLVTCTLTAQQLSPINVAVTVQDAVNAQLDSYHHAAWGLRYTVHRVDSKEDSLRDLIESADGNVARTVARNGQPLSAEAQAAEATRLRSLSESDMARRRRQADSSARYATDMIAALPNAMLYTLTPSQPQLPKSTSTAIVLDFQPNPQFHPASTAQALLTGVAGRVWIDASTHHLVRVEVKVIRDLNLMMGLLARVYQGGTMVYEQHAVGDSGHDAFSYIEIDVRLRELMVKNVPYHSTLIATDVQFLPTAPPYKQAIEDLLQARKH